MSKLFVDEIVHQSSQGSGTITLGASGETITTASGAKFSGITGQNYPAFHAYMSSNQDLTNNTATKLQVDTEDFDTDNMYDSSTNYRFTPTVAGKYYVYGSSRSGASTDFNELDLMIRLNGTNIAHGGMRNEHNPYLKVFTVIDMNGSSDYVELFGFQNSGGTQDFQGNSDRTYFGAYRLGA